MIYKKVLNFIDILFATIGFVIGAGIYVIIGLSAEYGKNYTWISFVISGILAIFTGLSYCELASIFKKNGSEYRYTKEIIGNSASIYIGYCVIMTEILVITTLSFGIGNYLQHYININNKILSLLSIIFVSIINYLGIKTSIIINNIITIIECFGLILIIFLGFKYDKKQLTFKDIDLKKFNNIIKSSSIIYFAYFGFDIIVELTEETKNSEYVIPNAMLLGIIISIVLYILVTYTSVAQIGWKALANSKTPLATVCQNIIGNIGFNIISFIALCSMFNTILMGHIGTSRFIQNVAQDLNLPFNMNYINEKTNTPTNAIIFITIVSIFFLLLKNLKNSTLITNITTLIVFIFVNTCVILLRFQKPNIKRPFKIPFNIYKIPITSIISIFSSLYLIYIILFKKMIKFH